MKTKPEATPTPPTPPAPIPPAQQDIDELKDIARELTPEPAAAPAPKPAAAAPGAGGPPAELLAAIEGQVITRESAEDMAASIWGWVFDEVESMLPWAKYPPVMREKAAKKTAPVIVQYQMYFPEWIKKHWAAVDLGIFVGATIYATTKAYFLAKKHAEQEKQTSADQAKSDPSSKVDGATRTA